MMFGKPFINFDYVNKDTQDFNKVKDSISKLLK